VLVVEPVADLVGGEGGEDYVGAPARVVGGAGDEQVGAVLPPECVCAAAEPGAGAGPRLEEQVEGLVGEDEVAADERGEPFARPQTTPPAPSTSTPSPWMTAGPAGP